MDVQGRLLRHVSDGHLVPLPHTHLWLVSPEPVSYVCVLLCPYLSSLHVGEGDTFRDD